MSEPASVATLDLPDHHHHHHDHNNDHGHGHGHGLTLADRHDHEAETYDAMAEWILATWTDDDYRIDPAHIPFANREHVDFLSDAIAQLGPLEGRRILEVGAGGGSLAVWLAQQGAEVVGIDVSGGILDVARRRAEVSGVADATTFVHAPIETFDPAAAGLDPAPFDAIIGNNVVHHFERDLAMANIGRLLAPGGVAVFCEPVLFVPEVVRAIRYSRPVAKRFPPHTHTPDERSLNEDDFAIMRSHFRHVAWKPFQLLCRVQNFVELSDPMWHRLEAIDRKLLASLPISRRACRMVVLTLGLPRTTPIAAHP
jgi:2-polyprenyl-3-methyl-5-hydroxy-6-metoxy-1,4-benzoquinol methylase